MSLHFYSHECVSESVSPHLQTHDVLARRTAVLRCLVVSLGDEGSDFFKVCFVSIT